MRNSQRSDQGTALEATLYEQILDSRGAFSAGLSERVRIAFRSHIESAGKVSLEAAFGSLPQRSVRTLARRLAEKRREAAYAVAYKAQADCAALAPWRRCTILGAELEEFKLVYWPAWRKSLTPSGSGTAHEYRLLLYGIFAAIPDVAPALSSNGVFQALKRAGVLT